MPGWPRSTRCSATPRCSHPEHAGQISRVLAIPPKKFDRALVTWLTEPEVKALLAAPGTATWAGRRDHAMILLAAQTGLRISELTGLTCGDVHLGTGPHVSCHGKGRKQRITPLTRNTVAVLRAWLTERDGEPGQPLFPSRSGGRLSRDAVEKRLAQHVAAADGALSLAEGQDHHHAHAAALCGWLGYVAGSSISAGSRAARARSGHITRWCYSQKRSSHARRSWSAVQSARGSGVSDW